ncbi:M48 family metallopeptidase [Asticcacaulis sp. AND118]|uniref:M48 family metallopeptidase n=1 Tax=Asticcacaulis sp. AND118 TaxID=2840468 RepID=UPI001CFF9040|nr:M48 family metallopeptidase [Asticcacaulis sp. AND118]UDF05199.1 M48 family metallopeptidase [Asticcacaulis sp. AND118]
MRPSLVRPSLAALTAALLMTAAQPAAAVDKYPERKPGQTPAAGTLEFSIWEETKKAERDARTSGERNHDEALNAYVRGVLDKVAGDYKGDLRLYVMDRPFFNASMGPNGYTEVWTGLLLRAQTEDEVAFVLGHEFAHYRHNHSTEAFENVKSNQNAAAAAGMVIAIIGAGAAANAGSYSAARDISNLTGGLIDAVYLGAIASYFAYSRDNETEADRFGNSYALNAHYDPYASVRIWSYLIEETKASDYERTRKRGGRINVFGSHPLESERVDALSKQADGFKVAGDDDEAQKQKRAAYRERIRPYLGRWLKDDLRRQDYGQTLFLIGHLQQDGLDTGLLNFYAGEAYRLRAKDNIGSPDLLAAANAYTEAAALPDAPPETRRQLGEVYRRMGRTQDAIAAYDTYLKTFPQAEDAWMVEDLLNSLKAAPAPAAPPAPVTN